MHLKSDNEIPTSLSFVINFVPMNYSVGLFRNVLLSVRLFAHSRCCFVSFESESFHSVRHFLSNLIKKAYAIGDVNRSMIRFSLPSTIFSQPQSFHKQLSRAEQSE